MISGSSDTTTRVSKGETRARGRHLCAPADVLYMGLAGCCVGRRPNRFLSVTRCRENLSSGEKRAVGAVNRRVRARQLHPAQSLCYLFSPTPLDGHAPGCALLVMVPVATDFLSV